MPHVRLGNLALIGLALLNILLWLIFPPESDGRANFTRQMISEIFSSTGMVLMACAMILALRLRILEPFFGGLDKMYQSHKTAALSGFFLILAHFLTMPGTPEPSLGRDLGKIALFGILVLILLSLAPRIPWLHRNFQLAYHHWRLTHKLIGAFFILGLIHTFNVKNVLQFAEIPGWYWKIMAYAGAAAYLYRILLAPLLARRHAATVAATQQLNATTIEITLQPHTKKLSQRAGQFMFVRFPGDPILGEPHPFTISSAPHEPNLRLSIKAAGDWTKHLYAQLKPGQHAQVDGCYGMFDYQRGKPQQIWIAGGIGITPFLSWVRSMQHNPSQTINLFYTVRAEADVLFWEEFAAASDQFPNLRTHLTISSRDGSLTLERIIPQVPNLADHSVYLCGPAAMTQALARQLREHGVLQSDIHYEEFNFR
jgi:predicted ferric reductase